MIEHGSDVGSKKGSGGLVRRLRPWLIGVVVLFALFVAADRITLAVAEHRAADEIRTAQDLSATPSVRVAGFPFLTQLASGTLDTVRVSAKNVVVGESSRNVRIADLRATLHHVHLHGLSSATADTATADVLLDYRELSSALGVPVSYGGTGAGGSGRIVAHPTVSVLGQSVTGTVSAGVVADSDAIRFVDLQASVPGSSGVSVPGSVAGAVSQVLNAPLSLNRLPFTLRLQSVRISSAGVTAVLTARNVAYG